MNNEQDPISAFSRPEPTQRGTNPFQHVPVPFPLEGYGLRAPDIFHERSLAARLFRNAGWLQARPRTSEAIDAALFPEYDLCGMEPDEVRLLLNRGLWHAGYTPDDPEFENPTWLWLEGESIQGRLEGQA